MVVPCVQMCGQELTPSPEMGTSASPVRDRGPIQPRPLPRRGEPPVPPRDSLTMSPPNGGCDFAVTVTLITLLLLTKVAYLPHGTFVTLVFVNSLEAEKRKM